MSKILVLKHPSGVKRTIQIAGSASLADVFTTASKQFNLNQNTHELKLGSRTLNLNNTIRVSRIPETVVLDIAPKSSPSSKAESDVLVQMGFSDEGYRYENCKKVMNASETLWNVVEVMVPGHMAYSDEDICLSYLGVSYKGKKRLKSLKLVDLCGSEKRLFFLCSRNYLQRPYRRSPRKTSRSIQARTQEEESKIKEASETPNQRSHHQEPKQDLKQNNPSIKLNQDLPWSISSISYEDQAEPTLGNPNPGIVELSDRLGRIYSGKYISSFTMTGDVSKASLDSWPRTSEDCNKTLVRIVFPNSSVLEGLFKLDETIKDVESFVKKYTVEEAHRFYLYAVQPKLIVSPDSKISTMKSRPPGTLWYCGRFKGELFKKDVICSLEGRVFSYASPDISEESKYDLRATSSLYFWSLDK